MENNILHSKKWLALIGVSIASFLGCADFTIVNTALPAIQNNLDASVGELQWIVNMFILALSSFMVIMGRLADIYGRRKVLYIGMVSFGIASLLAGCATNIQWLIFWRLIQGIACAILYTATGAVVSNVFPVEERGKAMGIFFGISFTGLAAGPVLGGLIVGAMGWRWVFLINIPVIIISFIICFMGVPESRNTSSGKKVDYLGALILMFVISALVIAITQGGNWGWDSYKTIGLLIGSAALLVILYFVEENTEVPIIKFSLFMNRSFIASIVATFFLAFFYCLAFFLMPLYLHTIRGDSDYVVGLMLLPTTAMVALVSPIIGKMVDRKGPQKPLLWGFFLFVISAAMQAFFSTDTTLITIIVAFVLMGVAWGSIVGPSTVLSMSSLPSSSEAVAIGTSWTLHNIGGAIGLGLGVSIYHMQLLKHNNSFLAGYKGSMLLLVASSLFAFLFLFWSFKSRAKALTSMNKTVQT